MKDSTGRQIPTKAYYIVTTDDFMSGWGQAEGKVNKLLLGCDSAEEALIVEANALARGDQKSVHGVVNPPTYDQGKTFLQYKDSDMMPTWYREGAFV